MKYHLGRFHAFLAFMVCSLAVADPAAPAGFLRLGFFDPAHTGAGPPAGAQTSTVLGKTATGYLVGRSTQADGVGQSLWSVSLGQGGVSRIGLTNAEHTAANGSSMAAGTNILNSGWIMGSSTRYQGTAASTGTGAWIANMATGTTYQVGLSGPEFVRSDGVQNNSPFWIYANYALGVTTRYSGANTRGNAVWIVALAAPQTTTRIGLFDAEHTRANGTQTTLSLHGTDALGYTAGVTERYNGGSASLGRSAWVADAAAGTTTRIGFYDTAHTFSTSGLFGEAVGYQYSVIVGQGSGGWIGRSVLDVTPFGDFNSVSTSSAWSTWFYAPAAGITRELGLVTGDFLRSDGRRNSEALAISHQGQVAGFSARFTGDGLAASVADSYGRKDYWVMDLATDVYTMIGLNDAEHRDAEGDLSHNLRIGNESSMFRFTSSGYLLGSTEQFLGLNFQPGNTYTSGIDFGASLWIYRPQTSATTRVGLFDATHTRSNGIRLSTIRSVFTAGSTASTDVPGYVSEQGYAGGVSTRYEGGATELGQSAWIANGATGATQQAGLYDAAHTADNGLKFSDLTHLTASGYGAGFSRRYNGAAAQNGQSVWLASGATGATETKRVGLFDTAHTSSGSTFNPLGEQSSTIVGLTGTGRAAGTSIRYSAAGGGNGTSAWAADYATGTTTRIGLSDGVHVSTSGSQYSSVNGVTDAGLVWGFSQRFEGENAKGQTAWTYNLGSSIQANFELSVRTSDGYAFSQIDAVNGNGIALGHYTYFDQTTFADLGARPFLWSAELGVIDLYDQVMGQGEIAWSSYLWESSQLLESNWVILAILTEANGVYGVSTFALTGSAVPEPATFATLAGLFTLGLAALRRRPRPGR